MSNLIVLAFDSADEAEKVRQAIKSQQNGKMQNVTMNAKGKWLGADCGNIKPIELPKQ